MAEAFFKEFFQVSQLLQILGVHFDLFVGHELHDFVKQFLFNIVVETQEQTGVSNQQSGCVVGLKKRYISILIKILVLIYF